MDMARRNDVLHRNAREN